MRRRRAMLFDDDPGVLGALALYFEERGYDVIACTRPVSCAVYEDSAPCERERPCADLVVTDLDMPGMSGIELLETQARRGCPLDPASKAILSGNLDEALGDIRRLGCAWFRKPFRFTQLEEWVAACEPRMDLSRPLGTLRREAREDGGAERVVSVGLGRGECVAEVMNRSRRGICLRIDPALTVGSTLEVRSGRAAPQRLVVRWRKGDLAGGCFGGAGRG